MRGPTWEPINATVIIEGEQKPLLTFATNRNMLAMYSGNTPAGGITAEVVFVASKWIAFVFSCLYFAKPLHPLTDRFW